MTLSLLTEWSSSRKSLLQHLRSWLWKESCFSTDSLSHDKDITAATSWQNAILDEGIDKNVASVVIQVVVDKNDLAFC